MTGYLIYIEARVHYELLIEETRVISHTYMYCAGVLLNMPYYIGKNYDGNPSIYVEFQT